MLLVKAVRFSFIRYNLIPEEAAVLMHKWLLTEAF